MPDQHIEQRRRHHAAQRHSSAGLASAALLSASLLPCCAISALCARIALSILREAFIDRGEIRRSRAVAARRDFTSLTAEASFSLCARVAASSPRSAATRFFQRSIRAARRDRARRLPAFDSRPATRAVRSSTAAAIELRRGGGACTGPAQHPADADHERRRNRAGDRRDDPGRNRRRSRCGSRRRRSAGSLPRTTPASPRRRLRLGWRFGRLCRQNSSASSETSVASRSMVGGCALGRSESGSGPVSSGLSSTIAAVPLNVRCRNLAESWVRA